MVGQDRVEIDKVEVGREQGPIYKGNRSAEMQTRRSRSEKGGDI